MSYYRLEHSSYLSLFVFDDGKLLLGVILSFFLNSRQRELLLRVIRTYFFGFR
jgi:hypothetical protein